ncbi:unnamed protein product [Microthlaspi erraticum]|uniref:Pentacotripeptide-repeat region of PRORP domain-containing protein n=1 Tax=Microthlaspi erraticum TaxID=1685480 RepID=A0A6D2KXR2_9BRAS|nr:unnamed protein product [Microthlaspi erraticum]
MTTFLAPTRFRSSLLRYRLINLKPFSSQSQFPNPPNNQSRDTDSNTETISELEFPHLTPKPNHLPLIPSGEPENRSDDVDDARVIEVLLGRKNDPVSALEYCNWVRPSNRICEIGDVFWVLIHILVTSRETYDHASNLLVEFVSINPTLIPTVMVNDLVESAQRFDFELNPRAFNYLLNAYIRNSRTDDAVDCFNLMLDRNVTPFVAYVNKVLSFLLRSDSVDEGKEVYDKMVVIGGVGGDNVTTQLFMRACLRERKPEEAVKIFKRVMSREEEAEPDSEMYSLAVQAACKIPDLAMALGLLRETREKFGVPATQETYTSVIVASVREGNMEEALRVKDEMVEFEIPMSLIAATSLISGYCKGNELGKALDLFDKMEEEGLAPDRVMFTVMIEWFVKKEKMEKAVEVYKRMKSAGVVPSSVLVHTMIQGCLRAWSPEVALEIFDDCFETGLVNGFMCSKILSLLCKRGKVDEARRLLSMMESNGIEAGVVSYNNVMLAHCRAKNMDLARLVFLEMLGKGIEPNGYTYSILIDGFFKNHDEKSAWDVFNQMVASNFEADEVAYNTFVNGLCKVGQTSKAREVLQNLFKEKRCFMSCMSYNTIIDGFFREGEADSAVETYREMSENGVSPNVVTFTSLINGFCKIGRMDLALGMIQEMKSKNLKLDIPAYGALIDGFCKNRDMETADSMFSELLEQGWIPNLTVYNSLISGYRNLGNMKAATDLYKKMVSDGIKCDLFTYTTLIDGLLKDGNLSFASDLYSEVVASGFVPDEVLYVVLVNGLSKKGQFLRASKMLEKKDVTPSVLIYSCVIAGHYREGNLDEAFRLYNEMLEKGLVPDDTIFDILVSGKVEKPPVAAKVSSLASPETRPLIFGRHV